VDRVQGERQRSLPTLRQLPWFCDPGEAETLHIRRLENGLERPCGRSRPAPCHIVRALLEGRQPIELTPTRLLRLSQGPAARLERTATCSRLRRLNLHQNPGETLHIRRLENGLKRPCGRSRPTPGRFASLVGTDAFAGELTRGNIRTFPATAETENTASFQGGAWLGDLDSNQD
jgi:hypothetical protein